MNKINLHTKFFFISTIVVFYVFTSVRIFSDEKRFEVNQKDPTLDEILYRLNIDAYFYHFNTTSKNLPAGYYVQFEHWQLGELKQTQKTKLFKLDSTAKESWVFVGFPSFPQKHVVVSPSGEDGEFRGDLNFALAVRKDFSSTSNYLKKVSLPEIKSGTSVVLGYSLLGIADMDQEATDTMKVNVDDPLSSELTLYHKLLTEHKDRDVDVIVFRLVFE